ncbi:MAG: UDP-N-acetylglucosamine-N-acetylmuramylpentapeptide N-acetylglucosamine transferase [Glomeribacter sp. 1016415]|uniref:UDP-N-acetylglucosamine--N-acetylmuramyl-(pentapeptide) pyrophosphoryl-undecaprenol N-acetylglucosamine transferase n=1 Tax=Mycoavidus cysteinexigens TaxID=1553431 RepID=A0A2Z6EXL5_9BURK|nr:undecaprenyldiphospho-muramoylpentapeptide beta-N-acetylglucosaminyltransferase [Mycoavidus cysteinexigens]MCX8566375.1 UDP-N-acetylglucosamine-N-acetylmuramylpentapeptide N-acetylglucosamine transferase [Glomeribacter sp. 1016415]BBE10203.1 undecaprenyldiphospho-muramoylpentapeptide beta-N- acetylglucosaminyltransferase [Mycoavidus cysteinexigens]GAM53435.1 UDP-N-acetylglucosamine--N-acetylmuramyl-(pentapeptide) pyrophosphoryl-undecaprenol N-acetylglucosamine transferase [bacterium endosymbi
MSNTRTLLIVAGGTGGHVFPGLAVAHRMRRHGWHVIWLGNPAGMEAALVPKHGIPIEFVHFSGLRGKGLLTKLTLPFNLLRAAWQSLRVLTKVKPTVVLGMGGYISFPAGMMAVLSGRPFILHEQNSIPGLANRMLAKIARRVLVAFPEVLPRAEWTGNPLRDALIGLPEPAQRYAQRSGPLRLLVVGGSLGAAALNEVVPRALSALAPHERPHVVHQAGVRQIEALRANYAAAGLHDQAQIELMPFIEDMAQAYAQADLVICRAGAMTIAEIAAVGVAALLVPFPHAVDDHQTTNAAFLANREAALMIQQRDLSAAKLALWLKTQTREALCQMAGRARLLAKSDAAEQVSQICLAVAERKRGQP